MASIPQLLLRWNESGDGRLHDKLAGHLKRNGPKRFVRALAHPSPEVRKSAAGFLAYSGLVEPILDRIVQEPDYQVQAEMIRRLQSAPLSEKELFRVADLVRSPFDGVRAAALSVLELHHDRILQARPLRRKLVVALDHAIRQRGRMTLLHVRFVLERKGLTEGERCSLSETALRTLPEALPDERPMLLQVLVKLDHRVALEALRRELYRNHREDVLQVLIEYFVRHRAVEAMQDIAHLARQEWLNALLCRMAIYALLRIDERRSEPLLFELAESGPVHVAREAFCMLSRTGRHETLQRLESVATSHPDRASLARVAQAALAFRLSEKELFLRLLRAHPDILEETLRELVQHRTSLSEEQRRLLLMLRFHPLAASLREALDSMIHTKAERSL